MKPLLCTLLLLSVSACSASTSSEENPIEVQRTETPEQATKERFEDILELMELCDESLAPLFDGEWEGGDQARKQLGLEAQMLVHGFARLQTTLKPKDVDPDFIEFSKTTQSFMQKIVTATNQDSASVQTLFADPRTTNQLHCGRCHDKYRDN